MAGITKRVTRLSDGRELIYFDDAESVAAAGARGRTRGHLSPRPALPTLRQDPLTGEWISSSSLRAQ